MGSAQEIQKVFSELNDWFLKSGQTLAFAESCTGGQLSSAITSNSGVSQYFLGSVISYARSAKLELLKVKASTCEALGEVSLPVAIEMARGARKALSSDWAVSVTGIAGPGGGSKEKPVGTVCFGVSGPGFEHSEEVRFKEESRTQIQEASVYHALKLLKLGIQS